jgi:hypothetical protein
MPTAAPPLLPAPITLAGFALLLVAAPSTAHACGNDGSVVFQAAAAYFVPLMVTLLLQGAARRYVSVRHHSVVRSLVGVAGIGIAAFGMLLGTTFAWFSPLIGAPIFVIELVVLLDLLVLLVAPRRPPLEVI